MRRSISILLIAVMMFGLVSVFAGCGGKSADYDTPFDFYEAYKGDDKIIGKTVKVKATHDYVYGQIYSMPMPNLGPTLYLNATGKGAENIKKDDEVILKITTRDSESKFMISFTGELVK